MDLRETRLCSARLRLRTFTPADAAEAFASVTPTLTRYMAFDPSPTAAAFAQVWRHWPPRMAAGSDVFLVARLAENAEFIGMTGLHGIDGAEPEVGIWIKEAAHGRAYGLEAVAALVGWAGSALGRPSVLYPIVAENRPSRRIPERLGGAAIGTRALRKPRRRRYTLVVYRIPTGAPQGPG